MREEDPKKGLTSAEKVVFVVVALIAAVAAALILPFGDEHRMQELAENIRSGAPWIFAIVGAGILAYALVLVVQTFGDDAERTARARRGLKTLALNVVVVVGFGLLLWGLFRVSPVAAAVLSIAAIAIAAICSGRRGQEPPFD